MDFEEAKQRLKWALMLSVAFYGASWAFMRWQERRLAAEIAAESEAPAKRTAITGDGREVELSPRLAQAADLAFKDPEAALRLVRAALDAPAGPDEKSLAEKWLASYLKGAHRAAGEAKAWERAFALYDEIDARPEGRDGISRLARDEEARWLALALDAGDAASADSLARHLIPRAAAADYSPREALRRWRGGKIDAWASGRAGPAASAAEAGLDEALRWDPHDADAAARLSRAGAPPKELLALARRFAGEGKPAASYALLTAVLQGDDRRSADAARPLRDAALLALAGELETQPFGDEWPPAARLLERVEGPLREKARARMSALLARWGDHLIDRDPMQAREAYRAAGDETKAEDADLRIALRNVARDAEQGLEGLRPFLRAEKHAARRAAAVEGLREAWRAARQRRSFDPFTALTAFWIAEAGVPPFKDPFYAELKSGLSDLAESSKTEALNKRAFVLSLLADSFPCDPEGREARREAIERVAELARTTTNRGAPPRLIGRVSTPGLSAVLVQNATPRHLLLYFEGPESFFVRVNAYRRGTVVFKNGKYLLGVSADRDEIVPYAAQGEFSNALATSRFVITDGRSDGAGESALGPWASLRAPDGLASAVDPASGAPLTP